MKIKLILLILFIKTINIFAQKELFNRADELIDNKEFDAAIEVYQTIILDKNTQKIDFSKAFYNIGSTYLEKGDTLKAKEQFLKILGSNFNEYDKGGKGSGIMQEPYALYKHNSCKNLAEIALSEHEYDKALKYTTLFEKKYKYQHFCGNEQAQNKIYTALSYGKCYLGLNMKVKALEKTLPLVINNGLANNSEIVDLSIKIINEIYTKNEILEELKNIEKTYLGTKEKHRKYTNYRYFYTFKGIRIEIPNDLPLELLEDNYKYIEEIKDFTEKDKERCKIIFRNSEFYKGILK